jgi:hypothetical protein
MSQFDHGKHPKYTDETAPTKALIGKNIPDTKRLDAQRTPKSTAARQADFDSSKLDAGAFNRPGTQNKAK